ncbi:MAG: hypothetical protein ACKVIF_02465, partial [Rhodospirillales bacterium]
AEGKKFLSRVQYLSLSINRKINFYQFKISQNSNIVRSYKLYGRSIIFYIQAEFLEGVNQD